MDENDDESAGLADGTTFPPSLRPEAPRRNPWLPLLVGLVGLASISLPLTDRLWPSPPAPQEPSDPLPAGGEPQPLGPPAVRLEFADGAILGPGPLPLLLIGAEAFEIRIDGESCPGQELPPELPPGPHVLEILARSTGGESGERRTFTFDPSLPPAARDVLAPEVQLLHPSRPWRTQQRHVAFRVRDPAGLRSVKVLLDGASRVPEQRPEDGWLNLRLDGLRSGPHTLVLSAVDRAGNERHLERRFEVVPP